MKEPKYKIGDKVSYKEEKTSIIAINNYDEYPEYLVEYSKGWCPGFTDIKKYKLEFKKRYHYVCNNDIKILSFESKIINNYSIY